MTPALMLLAAALLLAPGGGQVRARLARLERRAPVTAQAVRRPGWFPPMAGVAVGAGTAAVIGGSGGLIAGVVIGLAGVMGCRRVLRPRATQPSPLQIGGAWDLLAGCLRAGLPTVAGLRAVAEQLHGPGAAQLDRVADLMTLGAGPASAWAAADGLPGAAGLARAARRSATSGAALADVASTAAVEVRAGAADSAEAGAQRAAVAITGPLGLCFLPAFLALGVVPVVIGLAEGLISRW